LRLACAASVLAAFAYACGGLTSPGLAPDAAAPCAPGATVQGDPPSATSSAGPVPTLPPITGLPPYFYGDAGRPLRYMVFGDSMTYGLEGGTVNYSAFVSTVLGSGVAVFNNGKSGETLADIVSYEHSSLQFWYADGGANVTSILAGTNDMHTYDAGPADCYANLITFGKQAHADGFLVLVMTLPRPDIFVPDAMRAEYNRLIRAGWPSFADAFIDLEADPALIGMTIGDNVHPNGDGHQRIAARVAPVIAALLVRAGATRGEEGAGGPP
jgi:lysophospholipase L1-like esterase